MHRDRLHCREKARVRSTSQEAVVGIQGRRSSEAELGSGSAGRASGPASTVGVGLGEKAEVRATPT